MLVQMYEPLSMSEPRLDRPGPHPGLGGDLIDGQVAEVVQDPAVDSGRAVSDPSRMPSRARRHREAAMRQAVTRTQA